MKALVTALAALVVAGSAAHAADDGTVVRLTPAEIAAAQAQGLADHARDSWVDTDIVRPKRALHGEVGFTVGSRGTRAIYGTVVAPLGDDGYIALSLADSSIGRRGR